MTMPLCQYINSIINTCEWTPKRRSRALGLIEGRRHKLREISQITNIPIGTWEILRNATCPWQNHEIIVLISCWNDTNIELNFTSLGIMHLIVYRCNRLLNIFQVQVSETTLKLTLKDLGYYHRIARCRHF